MVNRKFLIIVILLTFLTRLTYFLVVIMRSYKQLGVNLFLVDESNSYLNFANNLLICHMMAKVPCLPSAFRTPAYPLILAGFFGLFGQNIGIWLMVIFQFTISIFTAVLVYLILVHITSDKWALLSSIIYVILIDPIIYIFLIATETLFTFLIVLSIYSLINFIKKNKIKYLIISGISLGLSLLTRPIVEFLPLVLCFALLIIFLLNKQRGFIKPLIILIPVLLIISPWMIRNYRVFGRADLSTIGGTNLYFYNYAYLEAYLQNKTFDEIQSNLRNKEIDESSMPVRSDFRRVSKQASVAIKAILSHPVAYGIVHLKGTVQIILGTSSPELYHQMGLEYHPRNMFDIARQDTFGDLLTKLKTYIFEKWLQVINLIIKGLLLLFAFLGILFGLWNKSTRYEVLVISLCALYLIALAGPQPFPRFGLPALPFLCILAGVGIIIPKTMIEKNRLHLKRSHYSKDINGVRGNSIKSKNG